MVSLATLKKSLKWLQILSLQDQLEKGPNAQLARLQQENSILRDALNQATSQAESKWVFTKRWHGNWLVWGNKRFLPLYKYIKF